MTLVAYRAESWRHQPPQLMRPVRGHRFAPRTGLWMPGLSTVNLISCRASSFAGSGGDPSRALARARVLSTSGKYVQSDLANTTFSAMTFLAIITPTAAPSGAVYSSFLQTGQATLNWDHLSASYQGAMTLYNGGAYPTCKFGTLVAGRRAVIAATYDGAAIRTFQDGQAVNTTTAGNSLSGLSGNALQFLGGQGGTANWSGSCELMCWDATRALSQAEVLAWMDDPYQIFARVAPVIYSLGAGGTTYNETVTESVTLTDAVSVAATAAPTVTESLSLSDAVTPAVTVNATVTESATLTDGVTNGNVYADTLTESVSLTDTVSVVVAANPTVTESLALADVLAPSLIVNATVSESVSLADTVTGALAGSGSFTDADVDLVWDEIVATIGPTSYSARAVMAGMATFLEQRGLLP